MSTALLSQPGARAIPPSESIAICNWEMGRRLARVAGEGPVAIYGARHAPEGPARAEGVEVRYVDTAADWRLARLTAPTARLRPRGRPLFASRLHFPAYVRRIAADLRRSPRDHVHVHNAFRAVPVLRAAAPDAVLVLHMHAEWLSQLPARTVESAAGAADAVLGCSDHVTARARAALPRLADRCHTLPNGVDLEAFAPAQDRPERAGCRLVAVGRLSPEKGLHVLVDALDAVLERVPGVSLTLVGDEAPVPLEMLVDLSDDPRVRALRRFHGRPYRDALLERATPRARAALELTGPLDHAATAAVLRDADVLVNPSLSESFGLSVLEGMAAGLPVVAARTGGMPELVRDGVSGLLVEPDDPAALAEAVARLAGDPGLRRRFGAAGRELAQGYSWDAAVARLREIYAASRGRAAA